MMMKSKKTKRRMLFQTEFTVMQCLYFASCNEAKSVVQIKYNNEAGDGNIQHHAHFNVFFSKR
jgi:hypothetical protein